ncbi:sensor histidine kinase [Marinobacter fonticola]|uniref:sensor histidine kinase n=1 Tax=Marinobacter fonticola TaxID=2603215 RepID=UPI00143CDCE3|nr:HAMP domain-containing sensor histidine kinase [Marinobacter fonticola]
MIDSIKPERTEPVTESLDFTMVMASAVHDMKNSLGMLLHSLDELGDEIPGSVGSSPRFNTLRYEAERVHGDLVQLLGLYRLDQDTLSAHIEEHFLPDYLEAQLARHVPLLEGHGLEHTLVCDSVSGYFDAELLAGVINNTVNNAIRYTRSSIYISAGEHEGYLVIRVADDGSGYPHAMLQSASSAAEPINFQSGSTRLGLYFAEAVAHLHRNGDRCGEIRILNGGPLGGGVFEIWLP